MNTYLNISHGLESGKEKHKAKAQDDYVHKSSFHLVAGTSRYQRVNCASGCQCYHNWFVLSLYISQQLFTTHAARIIFNILSLDGPVYSFFFVSVYFYFSSKFFLYPPLRFTFNQLLSKILTCQ